MVTLLALLVACDAGKPDDAGTDTGLEETGIPDETGGPDSAEEIDTAPVDADGDGWIVGEDCDDADPDVHPGAEDLCDGVDQDCDGDPQGEGACGGVLDLETVAAGAFEGQGEATLFHAATPATGAPSAGQDVNGDGTTDLLAYQVHVPGVDWSAGALAVIPGHVPDGDEVGFDVAIASWIGEHRQDWPYFFGSIGDFDGDGSTDLAITNVGTDQTEGSLYVILGPPERWTTGGRMRDGADGFWYDHGGNNWGLTTSAGGDVDGDGLDDIVIEGAGEHVFVPGRPGPLPFQVDASGETVLEHDVRVYDLYVLPDLDGDGLAEATVMFPEPYDALGFLVPESLASSTPISGAMDVVVASSLEGGARGRLLLLQGNSSSLGDADGDGYEDALLLMGTDWYEDETGLHLKSCLVRVAGASDIRTGDLSERFGWEVCGEERGEFEGFDTTTTPDVDGDDVRDVLWADPEFASMTGTDEVQCLVPSHRLPASGRVSLSEVGFCMWGGDGSIGTGALADLDGDGLPELLGDAPNWDRSPEGSVGRTLVVPGFEIPWDDPSKW